MRSPNYVTLNRSELKKVVEDISNTQLANIVGNWKPHLKPVRKRRRKEDTIFLPMSNSDTDKTIDLSKEQYFELTEWRNYSKARKIKNWKKLARIQWSSLSNITDEKIKTEIKEIMSNKIEFLENLPNPDYYDLSVKLISDRKELWITLEFANSPRPIEEWSNNEQRIVWREVLQISRIRAKITKSSRHLKISGRRMNLKTNFENLLIEYFTSLNPQGSNESKDITTEDISNYLKKVESGKIKDNIIELILDTNLPGIDTIIIEIKNYNAAKTSLRKRFNIDLDATTPTRIESDKTILEKGKRPIERERKTRD